MQLEAVILWKTSVGFFRNEDDAWEKKNRPKKECFDRFGPEVREEPEKIFAMRVYDSSGEPHYFEMNQIGVK